MKQITILLFIVLLIFLNACSKEKEQDSAVHESKISASLYPFLFKKDSYWIYENQSSRQLDSVVVMSLCRDKFTNGPTSPGQGPNGQTEFFNINYESSVFGNYDEQLVGYIISKGSIYGGYIYLSSYKLGDETKNAKLTNIYDSLSVNGILYSRVVKMENSKDQFLPTDMNLYYVDSIGVIKKELLVNDTITETWNLLRYSVYL